MAEIIPFRAYRYNADKVDLQKVLTQPYDKISPAMQQKYYAASPYNLIVVEKGKSEPGDTADSNVYTRAAQKLDEWTAEGILAQDERPAVYVYAQEFTDPLTSKRRTRTGMIALGRIEDYDAEIVHRHERTLAGPKADRLELLRHTRTQTGQLFMLYEDESGGIDRLLNTSTRKPANVEIRDEYDVLHRLWLLTDYAVIKRITAALADKKLVIADGHHRYETALAYARECRPADAPPRAPRGIYQAPAYPEAAVMMTFVNMDSVGLVILPTHRVVHSLDGFDSSSFLAEAREFFTVEKIVDSDATSYMAALSLEKSPAFVAILSGGAYLLRAKPETCGPLLAALPERQRQLDLSYLHSILLDRLLGLDAEKVREQTNIRYLRDAGEAAELVRRGEANVTFLTNPVTMEQLREVAFAGDVMPQKSTDFFPKLMSGLTIYSLD